MTNVSRWVHLNTLPPKMGASSDKSKIRTHTLHFTHTYTHVHTRTHTNTHVHTHTHARTHKHAHTQTCTHNSKYKIMIK